MKPTQALISGLESDKHSNINWKYNHYPNDNHITVYVNSFYDGMRFIFKSYSINSMRDRFRPELIINQFEKFSKETGTKFIPPEFIMNRLGLEVMAYYPMVPSGLDGAIKYFQTNIDNFPSSTSSLLNIGDAWLKKGNKEKALKCYKKVLELEKDNETVKKKIKEIE
jgi:tetratricopeptide (TPR) repeat protein